MVFKVTVQPSLPFQDPDFSTAWNDLTMDEQLKLHGQKEPIDQLDSRGKQLLRRTSIEAASFFPNEKGRECSMANSQCSSSNGEFSLDQTEGANP